MDTATHLTNKLFMDYLSLRNKKSHNENVASYNKLNFWQEDNYRYITKLQYVKSVSNNHLFLSLIINPKKGIQMIKYFTAPHELMNRKNPLHYALFDFKNTAEMKVFITLLAYSTMIFRSTKNKNKHTFSLKGLLSEDSFLPRKNISIVSICRFIKKLDSPFFEEITEIGNEVNFKLSKQYKKTIKSGFNKIDLHDLKGITHIRATKLKILTLMKPDGYFDLYYLFKVLDLNEIKRRDNKIAKIHIAFETLDIGANYKHPFYDQKKPNKLKESDEYYKFHYKTTIKEIVKEAVEKL